MYQHLTQNQGYPRELSQHRLQLVQHLHGNRSCESNGQIIEKFGIIITSYSRQNDCTSGSTTADGKLKGICKVLICGEVSCRRCNVVLFFILLCVPLVETFHTKVSHFGQWFSAFRFGL